MVELIKITENKERGSVVSARELHSFLGASERFSTWITRQFQYGFEEGADYVGCKEFNTLANQELVDYALSLDTSKEISMLQKSEKGKQARRYFIECENKLSSLSLPKTFSEALRLLADTTEREEVALLQLEEANNTISINKPKVVFADSVSGCDNSILIRQFAKDLSDDTFKIGQNKLFEWMRSNKYLNWNNEPYQQYINQGLFEVITRMIGNSTSNIQVKTTKITGRGQIYFSKKIKK